MLCARLYIHMVVFKKKKKESACVFNLVLNRLCSPGVPRNLRNDLLVAADSITNTMSSLVKELHSG